MVELPSDGGITWRSMTLDDAVAYHALHEGFETGNGLSYRTSLGEVRHELEDPKVDLAADTLVAVDREGVMQASCVVRVSSQEGVMHRGFVLTLALPGAEHLEEFCVRWGEARVREKMAERDDDTPRVIRGWAEAVMPARIGMYERLGFEVRRYFVEMARALADPIPPIELPPGVDVLPWDDRWAYSTWQARREAFVDHWGSVTSPFEEWKRLLDEPGTRLDLSAVAVADDEVVALSVAGVFPHDWEIRGRREGWILTLGTRRAWRRRGLASALLVDAMQRFGAEGLTHATLAVDAESPTGAFGLYTRLGFVETARSVALVKDW